VAEARARVVASGVAVTKEVAAAAVAYPMGVQVDTAAAAEAVAKARDLLLLQRTR
jgi:hypothetical protein